MKLTFKESGHSNKVIQRYINNKYCAFISYTHLIILKKIHTQNKWGTDNLNYVHIHTQTQTTFYFPNHITEYTS